jgi:hypothetical protein
MTTNVWRGSDLEALRIALLIPATPQAVRAINDAMRQREQGYPDAIPTAINKPDAIQQVDGQLVTLSIEQLSSADRDHPQGRQRWRAHPR